jgi:hypothetical protein
MMNTAHKVAALMSGGASYENRVLATGPLALWPLSETTGTSAADATGNYNGTYSNVTLNNATFPDGSPAGLWVPASSSHVATYSEGLAGAINRAEGTLAVWCKMRDATVWADGQNRYPYAMRVDNNNQMQMRKRSNLLDGFHQGGGTLRNPITGAQTTTAWFLYTFTWSTAAAETIVYVNTTPTSVSGALGTLVGDFINTSFAIGTFLTTSTSAFVWDGYLKYFGLWTRALTPAEIANLYVPGYAV